MHRGDLDTRRARSTTHHNDGDLYWKLGCGGEAGEDGVSEREKGERDGGVKTRLLDEPKSSSFCQRNGACGKDCQQCQTREMLEPIRSLGVNNG